ncbi:MAG: hypothetical protein JW966_03200 [Anaerolineae bacterium]|nr:hypothetical protein [Anaerolineae bacterium]
MIDPLYVRKVQSKREFNAFLKFPWTLYKDDPYWTPQLVSMQRDHLDPRKNPTWDHLEGDYFVAWRGDKPVGTIAVFINHRYNEFHNENIGFFGKFDLYDDQETATALLETAVDYLTARGCEALRGPATFSTNDECALLIDGFDGVPVVLMPYNYPYYQRLVENVPGFEKAMDLYSYRFTLQRLEESAALQKLIRVTHKNNARRNITVHQLDTNNLDQEFLKLKNIYNSAWDQNWSFVPFSDRELDEMVRSLGMFFDPELAFFAVVDDKPVAFLLGLPDMNLPLHAAYARPGKPELVSMLQVLWHWKLRSNIRRIRVMLMGVMEGYRGIGVESAMFIEIMDQAKELAAKRGWDYADGGWVLETNDPMKRLCEAFGADIYRRYRFYERKL